MHFGKVYQNATIFFAMVNCDWFSHAFASNFIIIAVRGKTTPNFQFRVNVEFGNISSDISSGTVGVPYSRFEMSKIKLGQRAAWVSVNAAWVSVNTA
jgi:hypothetical protein